MSETATERTIRLKQERESRKAAEKKMTPKQVAAWVVYKRMSTYEVTHADVFVATRRERITPKQVEKVNEAVKKMNAKFLSRLAKLAGIEE